MDLATGEGLDTALKGCDVAVDASNNSSRRAAEVLADGARRLLAAEQAAAVGHHAAVSVVGCERVPFSYCRVKAEQEQVIEHGPVPWSIVRATQFHELAAATLSAAERWRLLPVPRALLQTVAAPVTRREGGSPAAACSPALSRSTGPGCCGSRTDAPGRCPRPRTASGTRGSGRSGWTVLEPRA